MVTGQLSDTPTRGLPTRRLDISRTGQHSLDNLRASQLADWTTRGYRLCGHTESLAYICLSTHAKTLINGLTTIFNCILLWNTSIWHNDVFYVHIIIYLKLQLLPAASASCPVHDLSSPRLVQSASWLVRELSSPLVDQSARCPVHELAIHELAYPRVVHEHWRFIVMLGLITEFVCNLQHCYK